MAIRDIFKMIKADRYTQDGREELIKAQEAVTEDVTYKPGDISRKTGLQKQPDGSWAPVKNAPAQKKTDSKSGSGMSKHWVQKGDEADFVERTPEEEKKMWQGVASRQSDDKLMLAIKNREGRELKPVEKIKLEAAKEELAKRNASKVDSIKQSESKKWDDFFSEMDKKTGSAPSASSDWKSDLVSKLDTEKLKQMDNDFKEFEKSGRNISPEAKERNDLVKAELTKRKESASGSAPSMTSEQRKKWEAKASNPSETKASLTNFINSMENSESFKKANPHAQEIIDIYKTELKKREDNANYRPEKVYSDAPSELKIQGMSKEEYIPWRMKTYKENEAQASSMWNHFAEQQKNKGKENEYDPDFHPLRDSAPRILTGDCKVRIKKSK